MSSATAILARRNTLRLVRNPGAVVGASVTPVVLLLAFWSVFGRAMDTAGVDYAQYLVPGVTLQSLIFGAGGSAMAIGVDRATGILDRQRTLPISALAPVLGRLAADMLRSVLSIVILTLVGFALGFRFQGTAVETLVYLAIAFLFATAVCLLCDAIAAGASSPESAAIVVQTTTLPLVLLSTAYAPAEAMPDWAGPIVAHLPVSSVCEALRQASSGALTTGAVLEAMAWLLAIGVAGLALGVRAFRRTA